MPTSARSPRTTMSRRCSPITPRSARPVTRPAKRSRSSGRPGSKVSSTSSFRSTTNGRATPPTRSPRCCATPASLPGAIFWQGWREFPFSGTEWTMRPLGVQIMALAYRSDSAWNESGYANPAFDTALDRAMGILDAVERRTVMADLETMLVEDGVIIQPYWRRLVRHTRVPLAGAEIHPTREMHLYALGFAT